jgi:hypothetical protein
MIKASLLYSGWRDRVGLTDVRITLRGVKEIGPGQYTVGGEAEIVADNDRTLDYYAGSYDWYIVEGQHQVPKYDLNERLTRAEFLMELLERLDALVESVKYSPALAENIGKEVEVASHYVKGAYDLAELCDLDYLKKEATSADPLVPMS